jgi:hypothetical protein
LMKGTNIMRNNTKQATRSAGGANFQGQAAQWHVERSPRVAIPESWVSPRQKAIDESRIRALAAGLLIQKRSDEAETMVAVEYYANSRPCLELVIDQDGNGEFCVAPSKITREQAIAEISGLAIAESGVNTVIELSREPTMVEASSVAA